MINGELIEVSPEEEAQILAEWESYPSPRIDEIKSRLAEIDNESIRALRAVGAGRGAQADTDKLVSLETEAESLRAELIALGG